MRGYTQEQRRELLNKFYLMDLDHNGELSKSEIVQCLKDSNLPKDKLDEERKELLTKFYNMDTDGSGSLSREEIEKCLTDSHLPKSRVYEFISLFDADGDGVVTLDEYERALGLKEIPRSTIEEWRRAFAEMDVDNSGTLTVQEIHNGLLKINVNIPESDIAEFIRNVDDNGDGVLSVDEFTALMRLNT